MFLIENYEEKQWIPAFARMKKKTKIELMKRVVSFAEWYHLHFRDARFFSSLNF